VQFIDRAASFVNFEPQDVRKAKDIFKVGYDFAKNIDFNSLIQ
jgi:hypothetical protein